VAEVLLLLIRHIRDWNAIFLRDPLSQVYGLTTLAAKGTEGISVQRYFFAASRAANIHGSESAGAGRANQNSSAHDCDQQIVFEGASYTNYAKLARFNLACLGIVHQADTVDLGSLGL